MSMFLSTEPTHKTDKKVHMLRCVCRFLVRRITNTPPRALERALHLNLFDQF